MSHEIYAVKFNHNHDFRVKCRLYSNEERGSPYLPSQGTRSDFANEVWKQFPGAAYMIWPEFEDSDGNLIADTETPVPIEGTARMWIINNLGRQYIETGLKSAQRDGSWKVNQPGNPRSSNWDLCWIFHL